MTCTFPGNSDVLGIGIRIGYYTQVLATWFANFFHQAPVSGLRAANNLFLIAVICAGFTYFANAAQTQVIEVFLVLIVGLVTGLVGIAEDGKGGSKYVHVSPERLAIRVCTIACGAMFNVLFWWKALDIMIATPCDGVAKKGVGTYAWYGWKVSLYGWLRILMKVQSMFAALWTAPVFISQDMRVLLFTLKARTRRLQFVDAVKHAQQDEQIGRGVEAVFPTTMCLNKQQKLAHGGFQCERQQLERQMSKSWSERSVKTPSKDEAKQLLLSIERADEYITSIFAIYTTEISEQQRHLKRVCKRVPFLQPQRRIHCTDNTPYLMCLWRTVVNELDISTYAARCVLANHSFKVGQATGLSWPRLMNRMYTLKNQDTVRTNKETPAWQHMLIASDLRLAQENVDYSTSVWLLQAAGDFALIAAMIVQIEMTVVWNGVTGLNTLSSLGQLIPFIVGVGSLGKVVWEKVRWLQKGEKDVRAPKGRYEAALDEYNGVRNKSKQTSKEAPLRRVATV